MNKDLILKLRNQAIENVSNKRKLSDGQIERSWNPDDLDIEFAGLVAKQCTLLAMHQHTSKIPEHYSELDEYDKGCDDTASAIASNIRFCFGVKD